MVERGRRGRLAPAVFVAFCGLCCGVLLLRVSLKTTSPTRLLSKETAVRSLARDITGELFGSGHRASENQRAHMAAMRQRTIAGAVRLSLPGRLHAFPMKSGMMLDDEDEGEDEEGDEEAGEGGDIQDDEYARFVWRKERLEKEGVNVDTWLDPDLLGNIGFSDRPYTAGHHPADENITNTTTQFYADDWPKLNETTNATWIDDNDFKWNSPYDYVGARPLEADHHPLIEVRLLMLRALIARDHCFAPRVAKMHCQRCALVYASTI